MSEFHDRTPSPFEEVRIEQRKQRDALRDRLEDEGADDLVEALSKCGTAIPLLCTCCGITHRVERRCDRKWCPACQRALAARTSLRYEAIVEAIEWPLFVTLTTPNYTDHTVDFVRHVRQSFSRMRRLRWFRKKVRGGVASIEVSNRGNGWHPHIHALMDCRWLAVETPQPGPRLNADAWHKRARAACAEVAEQWSLCLRRTGNVHVRRVFGRDDGSSGPITKEVLKYSVAGSDLLDCPDELAPLIRMLDGCRLVTSWGTMYGHPAAKRPRSAGLPCESCGAIGAWLPEQVALAGWRTG